MLINRQCVCCGTWDYPIGPSYLRPEVQKEIDDFFVEYQGDGKQIMIPTPIGGLLPAEWNYLENSLNSYRGDLRNSAQLFFTA